MGDKKKETRDKSWIKIGVVFFLMGVCITVFTLVVGLIYNSEDAFSIASSDLALTIAIGIVTIIWFIIYKKNKLKREGKQNGTQDIN